MCDQFRQEWSQGRRPSIGEFLAAAPPDLRRDLLPALLAAEIQLRRAAGEEPTLDAYQRQFPDEPEAVLEGFWRARPVGERTDESTGVWAPQSRQEAPPDDRQQGTGAAGFDLGAILGRFRLVEQIGSGGFGSVWRAEDTLLKRTVALKIPRPEGLGPPEIDSLLREARAAACIKHPAVVQVYDAGEVNGTAYIASEYIDGRSLKERMDQQPLEFQEVARLAQRIALALDQAHQLGIIHRDLKPSNVLLDAAGNAYVTDFGLAKNTAEAAAQSPGYVTGTLAYMSPEQARGDDKQFAPGTDIYSLGVLIYEMLTGQRPFSGDAWDVWKQIQETPAPCPRRVAPRVPRDLASICLKCLAKDPAERYSSAAAVAEDLRRYLANEPPRARPGTPLGRMWRWCQRKPALAAWALSLAVAVAAATIGLSLAYRQSELARRQSEADLYFHQVLAAQQKWMHNDPRGAREELRSCPRRVRQTEWWFLERLFRTPPRRLEGAGRPFAYSPDGLIIATAGGNEPGLKIWAVPSGQLLRRLLPPNAETTWVSWVDFSPDGRTVLCGNRTDGTLRLWDAVEGRFVRVVGRHRWGPDQERPRDVLQARFVDQGRRIVSIGRDDTVRVWRTDTGQEIQSIPLNARIRTAAVFPFDPRIVVSIGRGDESAVGIWNYDTGEKCDEIPTSLGEVTGLAISADATRLALAEPRGVLQIWETVPLRHVQTFTGPVTDYPCPAFDPTGRRLAAETQDGALCIWDVSSGKEERMFRGHQPPARCLGFDPAGQCLAAGSEDGAIRFWDTTTEQGSIALRGGTSAALDLEFSPGGESLVATCLDGSFAVWNLEGRPRQRTKQLSDQRIWAAAFSPSGRLLACGCEDATVQILDYPALASRQVFSAHRKPLRAVGFSPDGVHVASADTAGQVLVWEVATGRVVRRLAVGNSAIRCLAFHPEGQLLAAGTRDAFAVVWDLASGDELWRRTDALKRVWSIAWSPDGKILAVSRGDGFVRLHRVQDGSLAAVCGFPAADLPVDLAFSPDGTRLATATAQTVVTLWEVATGREVLRVSRNTATAAAVAFHPQGQWIATADRAGAVQLWPAAPESKSETERLLMPPHGVGASALPNTSKNRSGVGDGPSSSR